MGHAGGFTQGPVILSLMFLYVLLLNCILEGCFLSLELMEKIVAVCLMPYLYKKPFIIDEDILFQEAHLLIQVNSGAPFSRRVQPPAPQ